MRRRPVNVYGILGLAQADAHVICNAGGVVTEDVIRSLVIGQRLLGTSEIMLIHHANCEMRTFCDEEFKAQIEADTGIRPPWSPEAFTDAVADVRQSIRRIKEGYSGTPDVMRILFHLTACQHKRMACPRKD